MLLNHLKIWYETCEPVDTPMVEKSKHKEDLQGKAVDPTCYRGMIGTLMYLTSSRTDLVFAMCMCARYQAKPTEKHLHGVKFPLRKESRFVPPMLDWRLLCHRRKKLFKLSLMSSRTLPATRHSPFLLKSLKSLCNSSGTLPRRFQGVDFTEVPDDETTLTFLINLGYKGPLYKHPSIKAATNERLRKSRIHILWGMFYRENVDYPELIWEDFAFQIDQRQLKKEFKPFIQPQRRLNPKVQDVVKNEIVKLLDSGLIYLISDSSWVSPTHVVPKKGGMTVILPEFPSQPEDQEKTTFTCPYRTFAYQRMPFVLCNAPATFQRCMTAIFHDMVEAFREVFMNDFSIFDNSFDCCLANLDRMLARCEETNLVMNWEKCHFMVKEGIVLGHKISGQVLRWAKRSMKPTIKVSTYYANKTLNNAQEHYTTTEKELLEVVFSFDKFRPYLVLSKLLYTPIIPGFRSICLVNKGSKNKAHKWVSCFFQGFDIEIKDKRGAKNLAADHLLRLENPDLGTFTEEEIADEFPDEHLMVLKTELNNDEPWYADYVNYLVGKIVPPNWTPEKRRRFFSQVKELFLG
ncbi:reverse transcriptase domain-containing protein [Tanacetum coccineum]